MNEKIVISRKWEQPEIRAYVTAQEVGAEMSVDEFLDSLMSQISNIPLTFTKETMLSKLKAASKEVFIEMRDKTKLVV